MTTMGEVPVTITIYCCSLYYSMSMEAPSPTILKKVVLQVTDQTQSVSCYFWIPMFEEINTCGDFY